MLIYFACCSITFDADAVAVNTNMYINMPEIIENHKLRGTNKQHIYEFIRQ